MTEINANGDDCVCAGTAAGGQFEADCTCSANYSGDKCNTYTCEGANQKVNDANNGCVCATGNFASQSACGSDDACASRWSPAGTCNVQCTENQVWATSACSDCADPKIPNSGKTACECTADSNVGEDCACSGRYYSAEGAAFKQTCDTECTGTSGEDQPFSMTDGLGACSCGTDRYYAGEACGNCPEGKSCNGLIVTGCTGEGEHLTGGGACETCPEGKSWNNSACVCPAAQIVNGDACQDCPSNMTANDD